jgi:hypothetical protein
MVVAFFTQFVDTPIQDYTSELRDAPCSNGPLATSALSDVWRATIRKGTHVAVKCVRTAVSGDDKVVKVRASLTVGLRVHFLMVTPAAYSQGVRHLVKTTPCEHTAATWDRTIQGPASHGF